MDKDTLRRWWVMFTEAPAVAACTLCGISPRAGYAACAGVCSLAFDVREGPKLESIDFTLGVVALCFLPLFVYETWRASGPLSVLKRDPITTYGVPAPLLGGVIMAMLSPAWIIPLSEAFGVWGTIAALVWWPTALLSYLAFVVAVAQIDAERRGETPRTVLLNVLHHLGGFVGVYLARRQFPDSTVCDELLSSVPAGPLFVAALVGLGVLTKVL